MPGKNKVEKRKKKEWLEAKIKSKQSTGTTLMNILQGQTEESHLFLHKG